MPSKNEQVKSKKAKGKKQEFLYHEDHACPEPVEWEGTRSFNKDLLFNTIFLRDS